jgi:hypothetical protein
MPGYLENIDIELENCSGSIDYLAGNIFQKVQVTTTVRFETWINLLIDEEMIFADPQMRTSDWIRDNTTTGRWKYFNVGDEINISNANTGANNGSYLISEKLSDSLVRVTDTMGSSVTLTQALQESAAEIRLVQDPLGMTYDYGLIENSEGTNFRSKVDSNEMRYELSTTSSYLPAAVTQMTAVGKKSWQLGGISVENKTTSGERDNSTYTYEFVHTLYIHPFYLDHQLTELADIVNNTPATPLTAPRYFKHLACLKLVQRMRAYRDSSQDPNVYQELIVDDINGNTGWFDEEYNGGTPEYEIEAGTLTYEDANANTLTALELANTTSVSFTITELGSEIAQYACVNFIALPEDDADYKNLNTLLYENYVWDRALLTAGSGAVNGENFGSGYQVISNLDCTVNVGSIDVTLDFDFGADAQAKINTLADKRYLIAVYVWGNGLTASTANFTTLLLDVNKFITYIPDNTIDVDNDILFHDQNEVSNVQATPIIKVEDEIVIDTTILLDRSSLDVQFDAIRGQVIATDATDTAVLHEIEFDLSQQPLVGDVRFINATHRTPFNVNSSEIRAEYRLFRDTSQDAGNDYAYRLQFPWLYRWEYWEQLLINSLPADFLDTSLDFNGYNHDWYRLSALAGWDIKYRISADLVTADGTTTTIVSDETLTDKDYDSNTEWDYEEILCFDGATALTYSSDPYIMTNKRTKVQANFTYTGADPIDENDVFMVARLIPKENGTYIANDSFSSVWNRDGLGAWTSNDGSTAGNGKIVITENAGVFTGTAYIDHEKLPDGVTEYTISWSVSRNTEAAAQSDWGEVFTQNVLALEVIDFDPSKIVKDDNPYRDCCLPLEVYASSSDTDSYKNDFTGFLKGFPLQYTVTMYLQRYDDTNGWQDEANLNGSSAYGTPYAQGFQTRDNMTYIGYKLEWRDVLTDASLGEGKYRIRYDFGTNELFSESYCLREYYQDKVDRTVRITYNWNSVIGDQDQTKQRDFSGFDWDNQIRLNNAMLWQRRGSFEKETVRFQNGKERSVSKNYREEYTLEVTAQDMDTLKKIVYDILMADDILIADYNSLNVDNFVDVAVEVNGNFEPNYDNSRPYPSVEIEFIDKYDNRRKLYS